MRRARFFAFRFVYEPKSGVDLDFWRRLADETRDLRAREIADLIETKALGGFQHAADADGANVVWGTPATTEELDASFAEFAARLAEKFLSTLEEYREFDDILAGYEAGKLNDAFLWDFGAPQEPAATIAQGWARQNRLAEAAKWFRLAVRLEEPCRRKEAKTWDAASEFAQNRADFDAGRISKEYWASRDAEIRKFDRLFAGYRAGRLAASVLSERFAPDELARFDLFEKELKARKLERERAERARTKEIRDEIRKRGRNFLSKRLKAAGFQRFRSSQCWNRENETLIQSASSEFPRDWRWRINWGYFIKPVLSFWEALPQDARTRKILEARKKTLDFGRECAVTRSFYKDLDVPETLDELDEFFERVAAFWERDVEPFFAKYPDADAIFSAFDAGTVGADWLGAAYDSLEYCAQLYDADRRLREGRIIDALALLRIVSRKSGADADELEAVRLAAEVLAERLSPDELEAAERREVELDAQTGERRRCEDEKNGGPEGWAALQKLLGFADNSKSVGAFWLNPNTIIKMNGNGESE